MNNKKVLIALSGGVDSSVAAFLLTRQGYDCVGVTFRMFDGGVSDTNISGAREISERLNIPLHVYDCREIFKREVMDIFARRYTDGLTPNPCVDCNRKVKFAVLSQYAAQLDILHIATGHYARAEYHENKNIYSLKKAADIKKDQSYMLYTLSGPILSRVLFPLGGLAKEAVREIARGQRFASADRPESQDICFVPDGDHAAFIENYTEIPREQGDFIDTQGNVLGKHAGLARYTIGQRKKLIFAGRFAVRPGPRSGLDLQDPVYVCAKDAKTNTVTLGGNDDLFTRSLVAAGFNWITRPAKDSLAHDGSFRAKAKIRYHQAEQPCRVMPVDDGTVRVEFDAPQRAVAPGQAVVVYDGDTVLGGGTIL